MRAPLKTDVCVVGGGPAGSSIALRLTILGYKVCLLERAVRERPRMGESLPPNILPLLDMLGVRARVERAGFLRPDRAVVRWREATDQIRSQPGPPGFLVDRARFDALLLQAVEDAGVLVLRPATAGRPCHEADRQWKIPVLLPEEKIEVHASFLVEATGRRPLLPSQKLRYGAPTLAIYAYWRSVELEEPVTRLEASADAWFWGAPMPDGTFNATVFLDPNSASAGSHGGLETFYRSLLAASALLAPCLKGDLCGDVVACNASNYRDVRPVGDDYIKVGEASYTLDPLSSQGVRAAIGTGCQGSAVVHTLLKYPDNNEAAKRFYRERQIEAVAQHLARAAHHYAEPQAFQSRTFWQKRAMPTVDSPRFRSPVQASLDLDMPLCLAEAAEWVETPCIRGDIVQLARALYHPALERPFTFLYGQDAAALLEELVRPATVREIIVRWSLHLSRQQSLETLDWLYRYGVLIPFQK